MCTQQHSCRTFNMPVSASAQAATCTPTPAHQPSQRTCPVVTAEKLPEGQPVARPLDTREGLHQGRWRGLARRTVLQDQDAADDLHAGWERRQQAARGGDGIMTQSGNAVKLDIPAACPRNSELVECQASGASSP